MVLCHRSQIRLLIRLILGGDLRLIDLLLARLNFGCGNGPLHDLMRDAVAHSVGAVFVRNG